MAVDDAKLERVVPVGLDLDPGQQKGESSDRERPLGADLKTVLVERGSGKQPEEANTGEEEESDEAVGEFPAGH